MIPAYGQNANQFGNAFGMPLWWGNQNTSSAVAPAQPPQQSSGIDGVAFVQGENAALAYIVPSGKTFLLIDTVEDRIYFKSADAYGRPSPLNDFWLTKTKPNPAPTETTAEEKTAPEYVTREEFDALKEQFESLAARKSKLKKAEEGDAE